MKLTINIAKILRCNC